MKRKPKPKRKRLVRGKDFDSWAIIDVPTGKVRLLTDKKPMAHWVKRNNKTPARERLWNQLHIDYCGFKECCRVARIRFVEVKP